MITHQEAEQLLAPYALGALSAEESQHVEDHLQGCSACRQVLREDLEVVASIPLALPQVQPPPAVRARLLQRIAALEQPQPMGKRPLWRRILRVVALPSVASRPRAVAYASLAVAVLAVAWAISLQIQAMGKASSGKVEQEVRQLAQANAGLAELLNTQRQALYWAISPAVQRVDWRGPGPGPTEWGNLMISQTGTSAMLMGANLKRSPSEGLYQVWLLDEQGNAVNVGYLRPDDQGWGSLFFRTERPMKQFKALSIVLAPGEDKAQPAGTPVARVDFR